MTEEKEEQEATLKFPIQATLEEDNAPSLLSERALVAQETTAKALSVIANFLVSGQLDSVVNKMVLGNGANGILSGLAHHSGRNALDARVLRQNSIEIAEQMMLLFDKLNERLASRDTRNPDMVSAEKSQGFESDTSEHEP